MKVCPKCSLESMSIYMNIIDYWNTGKTWVCPRCGYTRKIRNDKKFDKPYRSKLVVDTK